MNCVISRHLEVKPEASSGYLLENLYAGTRMVAGPEIWGSLEGHQSPAPLSDDELARRSFDKKILCPSEQPPIASPVVKRLTHAVEKVLKARGHEPHGDLLADLHTIEQVCQPEIKLEGPRHYLYQDPTRVFRVTLHHARLMIELEARADQNALDDVEFARAAVGRPRRKEELEQQPCTLATTLKRVRLLRSRAPKARRVLLLGDDDLLGLALGRYRQYQVDVLEYDRELLDFLEQRKPENLTVAHCDLTLGLPEQHHRCHDVLLTDPMYAAAGMKEFLRCCGQALKPGGELYISTCPALLEDADGFFAGLEENGLRLQQKLANFNRYPFPRDVRRSTRAALVQLGYDRSLASALLAIPYLYADLYVCRLEQAG